MKRIATLLLVVFVAAAMTVSPAAAKDGKKKRKKPVTSTTLARMSPATEICNRAYPVVEVGSIFGMSVEYSRVTERYYPNDPQQTLFAYGCAYVEVGHDELRDDFKSPIVVIDKEGGSLSGVRTERKIQRELPSLGQGAFVTPTETRIGASGTPSSRSAYVFCPIPPTTEIGPSGQPYDWRLSIWVAVSPTDSRDPGELAERVGALACGKVPPY